MKLIENSGAYIKKTRMKWFADAKCIRPQIEMEHTLEYLYEKNKPSAHFIDVKCTK